MSWFLARIYDRFMDATERACLSSWRADLLAPLRGQVLEIGAGTGSNLRHYGTGVERLVLTEPEGHMRALLVERVSTLGLSAEVVSASADSLPFEPGRFDFVVSTLVLCSVPDPARALAEAHRVLADDGRLIFIEHVAADDRPDRLRWQRRIEPLWVRVADGCHLTRRTETLIEGAGFRIESVRRESMRKALPIFRPSIRGIARKR